MNDAPSSRLVHGAVVRWNRTQVVGHLVLLTFLLVLGLTGLALKYNHLAWAGWIIERLGGVKASGYLHRAAALGLIAAVVHHLLYSLISEYGNREFRRLKLGRQDFRDFGQALRFNLGSVPEPPRTDKYGYQEKFHYWAVALIVLLMVPSGLVLWFENQALMFLPKWVYDLTLVLHGGAGLFFFAVVLLSHLYSVHLDPRVFPMSWVWLTGLLTPEQLRELHPREYEELKESGES